MQLMTLQNYGLSQIGYIWLNWRMWNNHARLPLTTAHYPTYVLLPDDLFAKVADV